MGASGRPCAVTMIKLPEWKAVRDGAKRVLHPRTWWGRATVQSGLVSLLLNARLWTEGRNLVSGPALWTKLFTLIFVFCLMVLFLRWARWRIMWRLRHRLIVTYLFIGVIPVVLLVLMAGLSGYLFAGQFATYAAISDLQAALQYLETPNDAQAARLAAMDRSGRPDRTIAGEFFSVSGQNFPQHTVTVWNGDEAYQLSPSGARIKANPVQVPSVIKADFRGFVLDNGILHLRAVHRFVREGKQFTVIIDSPITPGLLQSANRRLGAVTLIPPEFVAGENPSQPRLSPLSPGRVESASLLPPLSRFDQAFSFYTLFDVLDWKTGDPQTCMLHVVTRPSLLYGVLFSTMGDKAQVFKYILIGVSLLFGLVELIALYIGFRLTRSMTRAVADLYDATEHVNRGDLTHRIVIRGRDQMAALEESFNSMTESLVEYAAEQKRMQRMENELAIAYEVQEVLFPRKLPELASLDIYGLCRPARLVSGDYYDFIPLGRDRLVLAVGDISGKGISAALLMATTHAFIRAFSQPRDGLATPAETGAALRIADRGNYFWADSSTPSRPSVGMLMSTLNQQLYRCTAPEKYATMFLGCYDEALRELTFCNAGHLPPILLGADGSISRLDTSGTVIGLFDGTTYGESTIVMKPGDLIAAYSDGVTEPENASGEFGEERLLALLKEHQHRPLPEIGDAIASSVADWIGGAEPPDDVTVVLARAR